MRTVVFAALCALPFASQPLAAQDAAKPAAASPYLSVVGTVESEDLAKKTFTVKPDKTDATTVKFDDRTAFLRLPAGETDVNKATKVAPADVGVGDRILARVWADSPTGKPATRFLITKQADLAQRQQKTLEEWQTQSVVGNVTAVDSAAKTVTMHAGSKDVTVDVSGKVNYERYSPETGKYQASDGSQVAAGDRLRVLGNKNADVTAIKADAVQSGAFLNVGAVIKTVDAGGLTIAATNPATKKPFTITLKPFTTFKRLDDRSAQMLARQLNPNFQAAGGGRGGRGGGAPGAGGPPAGGGPGGPPAGFGGGRGGGGRGMDPARVIEQQETIQLADLKPGESLIVMGVGDPAKLTAITVVAGADPILRASANTGADPLAGSWSMGEGGGGGGGN